MTIFKDNLDTLLHNAHMTRAELARTFDIAPRSISHWNHNGIPHYAIAYLELKADNVKLLKRLLD